MTVPKLHRAICANPFDTKNFGSIGSADEPPGSYWELTWCGAGHPSPFLIRPSTGDVRLLGSQNPLIGLGLPNSENPTQETVPLEPGDRLLFFTDGVFEVANAGGRQLGMEGLAAVARATVRHDLFDVSDAILGMVREYQVGPNADDQTLVVAELR